MKIILTSDKTGSPLRVYHHANDVLARPSTKTVSTFEDGNLLETWLYTERSMMIEDDNLRDISEIFITFTVSKLLVPSEDPDWR